LRLYEGMFLLDDARCNENLQAATAEVHAILEKNQAEVFTAAKWDERRLCYPIKGHSRAVYYLVRFTAPGDSLHGIERDAELNDTILRHLVLRDEANEKLHKAGLLALRPGEPGESFESLGKRVSPEPVPYTPGRSDEGGYQGGRDGGSDGPRYHRRDRDDE
jgi:small subunit ribosomal protein S6